MEYYIDIEAIMDFVSQCPKEERNFVTTTTFTTNSEQSNYDDNGSPFSEVSETKYSKNDTMSNIRYDLVKTLMSTVLNNFENYTMDDENYTLAESNFATKVAFNSLLQTGLIKEKNE